MRRRLMTASLTVALLLACSGLPSAAAGDSRRVLILGVDGLDPDLLEKFVAEGRLPNFQRMIANGDLKPLTTSMPPLSPIAWSNFITGMDPGGHGIFDFIHRRLDPFLPYSAMAEVVEPGRIVRVGGRCFPARDLAPGFLKEEAVINLRKGTAFWEILEDAGVPTTVFRMPVNFPPVDAGGKSYSGMGTPDIRGSLGEFSYFSDVKPRNADDFTGGDYYPVQVLDNQVHGTLLGPKDPFDCNNYPETKEKGKSAESLSADFTVYLDPEKPIAKFQVQDEEFILREGEWSPWIPVGFEVGRLGEVAGTELSLATVGSIGRFYLKQVRPTFKLYVSPLQIDPADPAQPVSTPSGWSKELFQEFGRFYTQQLPADTKAFSNDVLTGSEFWEQTGIVFAERSNAFDYLLENFDEGLLFFYFTSVDQNAHMLWNFMDPEHPNHKDDELLEHGIRMTYEGIDAALGRAMERISDDTTLIVMSDHGFSGFYRQVNLNTWLLEKGYIKLRNPDIQGKYPWFANVDWTETKAYAAGINGLYVNLRGREKQGIVNPSEYEEFMDRLATDLLEMRDPENGEQVVTLALRPRQDYHGPYADTGPDILVGYNRGYRGSWKTPLGEIPRGVYAVNDDAWSGDHAMDYRLVPGVLISNRRITMDAPALYDLTVAILDEYGVAKTEEMIGHDCLGEPVTGSANSGAAASE